MEKTHKSGIYISKSVDEAYRIDKKIGNDLWNRAISKEMTDVKVEFELLEDGENLPTGYNFVRCHMIFDVKMEEFCRKARLVAGGHMTETPANMTYASAVSCETV